MSDSNPVFSLPVKGSLLVLGAAVFAACNSQDLLATLGILCVTLAVFIVSPELIDSDVWKGLEAKTKRTVTAPGVAYDHKRAMSGLLQIWLVGLLGIGVLALVQSEVPEMSSLNASLFLFAFAVLSVGILFALAEVFIRASSSAVRSWLEGREPRISLVSVGSYVRVHGWCECLAVFLFLSGSTLQFLAAGW